MTVKVDNATLRLAIYDPLQLDEQDFLNTFVARTANLKRLTRHVRENIGAKLLQHRLIFGQRGMGKTSLLRRLAISIKDDPTLAEHWIPLNFREEQYNIAKLDHFWKNCADVLADWCERQGDIDSAGQLDEAILKGSELYDTIRKTAKKNKRRLLLLVDNLNLILDSLPEKDQWALREKLQAKDAPLMIGCTPSHLKQLADRKGAFYDFFAIDDLKPLTPVEMRECLTQLAQTRGEPGAAVLEDMRRFPARIRVMHTLCGGNPRTLVLIYQVLETIVATKQEEKGDIGQLLEGVLENTTPLYKARTEELPPQQRRIIDAVALAWDPVHSSDIARITGLETTSLSAQLKRLKDDGLLQQVSLGHKRKGYQMAERFYNIWYLMRHGARRNRLRLRWLSSFLSTYYSDDELHCQAKCLITNGCASRNVYSEALMHAIDDGPLQNALRHELTRPLTDWDERSLKDLIPGEDYEPKLLSHADRRKKLLEGLRKTGANEDTAQHLTLLVAESVYRSTVEKQRIADQAGQLSEQQIADLINQLERERQYLDKYLGKEASKALREVFASGKLTSRTDPEEALSILAYSESRPLIDALLIMGVFENADSEELSRFIEACTVTAPSKAKSWNELGYLLQYKLQHYAESEQAYRNAIQIDPNDPYPWHNLGNLLMNHLKRYEESEQAYRNAIEIDPKFAYPWNNLGNLLMRHLNRFEESEQAYRNAIEIDPKFAYPWHNLGNLLTIHLKRYEESEQAYRNAIEIDPKFADPWNGLGNLLMDHLNRFEESEQAYRNAIEIDPKFADPWNGLGNLLQKHLKRYEESEQAYRNAIELDPKFAYPWNGLGTLLKDHLKRYEESEQAYRNAIEIDPKYAYPWNGLGNLLRNHLMRYEESEQAYKNAIEIDPNDASPWNNLGNLLQDNLQRYEESEQAYLAAEKIDPEFQYPNANRAWAALRRGNTIKARELTVGIQLPHPGKELLLAGCDMVDGNPGSCCDILEPVLQENPASLWIEFQDDLLRLTRLIKKHNFAQLYMDRLQRKNLHLSLEPYVAAAEAYFFGYERLLRLNPEARSVAESLYGWLTSEKGE